MKKQDTYLAEKYQQLYGAVDCQDKIAKIQRWMRCKYGIAILLFFLLLGAGLFSQQNLEKGLITDSNGKLISVKRPESGTAPLTFMIKATVNTEEGVLDKDLQITVDPYNSEPETNGIETKERKEKSYDEILEQQIQQSIREVNQNTKERHAALPAELESGESISWEVKKENDVPLYFVSLLMVLYLLHRSRYSAIKKQEIAAKASIIQELPEFINKLILLLNAGAVLNTAFVTIVEDRKKTAAKDNYFYQQMDLICESMKSANGALQEEFRSFARRSGVKELMRVANIIYDNIKKGTDLAEKLQRENELLWFARKQQAEEKGRLAETKLTLPLMVLLMVLVLVCIAPAMMDL